MSRLTGFLTIVALACATGGCAIFPGSTDDAYPVYGNPVNPTPVNNYRVQCTTLPGPTQPIFDDFYSGCRQLIVPTDVAIQVRG